MPTCHGDCHGSCASCDGGGCDSGGFPDYWKDCYDNSNHGGSHINQTCHGSCHH